MNIIVVVDKNWAIGRDGGLLVHLPGDLKYFKERTEGKTVIMGRNTLESLPGKKPLPNRDNIIMTRNQEYKVEGAKIAHSMGELAKILEGYNKEDVFILGGEKIYNQYFPYCDTYYVTKIYEEYEADKHFYNLDEMSQVEVVWQSDIMEENGTKYQFFKYKRK